MNKSKLKKITSARLFLPIVCLIAVLLLNVIKTPDFFNVSIRNGVLYGYIIDVINRASELVILAIGMTLVTAASGGQDISVGAVMAVAAAVCCQILSGGQVSGIDLILTIDNEIIMIHIPLIFCPHTILFPHFSQYRLRRPQSADMFHRIYHCGFPFCPQMPAQIAIRRDRVQVIGYLHFFSHICLGT